jgi:hypothetical protein
MEAVRSFEMSGNGHQTTWCNVPEDSNLNISVVGNPQTASSFQILFQLVHQSPYLISSQRCKATEGAHRPHLELILHIWQLFLGNDRCVWLFEEDCSIDDQIAVLFFASYGVPPSINTYNYNYRYYRHFTHNIIPSRMQQLLSLLPLTTCFDHKRPSSGVSVMPKLFHCPHIHITCNCYISRFKI